MTKAVLESEGEGEARRTDGAVSPPVLAVPASLQASLMARLDRLGPAKEVAQIGAAIGRQFSHALLSSVVRQPDAELESALDRLVAAGLLFRQGAPPDATYLFKHALVQDTAYGTLLRNQRQELHARIAKVLEQEFQGIIGTQPETLAHHYSQAGLVDLAIEFWGRAGARSADRSAHHEAVGHFGCALDVVGKLPPSHQRDERELELTLALAVSLIAVHGFGSIRVEECAVRAKELSDKLYWVAESLRRPTGCMEFQPDAPAGSEDGSVGERLGRFGRRRRESGKTRRGASGIRLLATYCGRIPRGRRNSCSGSNPRRYNFGGRIRDLWRASKHGLPSLWRAGKNLDGFPRVRDEAH